MPIYKYKARDEEGRLISGRMDVSKEGELYSRLENSGFFLVEFSEEKRNFLNDNLLEKFLPITSRDMYTLTLQLANTVSTGLPLLVSLLSIAKGFKNKKLVVILESVTKDLKSGSSFSEALRQHPAVFSRFYTSMVELGEVSGTLSHVLYGLAEHIKKEMAIRRRIVSAISYPLVLTVIGTGLVCYVLIYIMPQFLDIFVEAKVSLPLPTLILLFLSNLMVKYWYLLLAAAAGIIMGFRLFIMNDYGRLYIDRLKLKLPVVGDLMKQICAKRFIDGLYLLYSSGLPILKSINIVKSILRNRYVEKIMEALETHISAGKDLAGYLSFADLFPTDILAMIKSGEESGTLQKMLEKVSAIYQDEVNEYIERLIVSFEMLVILIIGLGVGFVAMAILFPIFRLGHVVAR